VRTPLIRWIVLVLGVLVIVVLAARLVGRRAGAGPDLPVLGDVPAFALTEANGRTITRDQLLGRPWIADFIFTRCAGTCPVMSSSMSGLHDDFLSDGDLSAYRFVSVSVDPDYDTPEVLREYARLVDADPERWFFLTGDFATIHALSQRGFHLGSGQDADTNEILHSTKFVLVDRAGKIRGYYDGTVPEEVAQLAKDARVIAREPAS
jgi:protein SCO1/2